MSSNNPKNQFRSNSLAKAEKISSSTLTYILVVLIALVAALPTVWAIITSFLNESDIVSFLTSGTASGLTFDNYAKVFTHSNVMRWFLNSFIVAISETFFYLLIASLAAYGFSKLKWKGRNLIFWICMFSMMVPGIINFIPNFIIIDKLGLYDHLLALILPGLSGVFGVFLLRQFMLSIPKDYSEAAKIDGANDFQIYGRIVLPMCGPALASLAIFTFQGSWNDFLWPLLVTSTNTNRTLTAGLYVEVTNSPYYGYQMACAIVSALPIILVFIFGQKYFTEGLSGGLKG
jgi:multiple sugar transport system permease protein